MINDKEAKVLLQMAKEERAFSKLSQVRGVL